ncbi:MAG TPA: succinate dehydrogenase iron-sulfur subunit [Dehalococcoidales bacterium]|nr:succinate dehydrogenase iron-sulfur subunit [Dehalococcoidales bacterium]
MAKKIQIVKFRVQRYNPAADTSFSLQDYSVPLVAGMTVLEGLIYIKENLESTLAFRTSCRMGICGSCAMFINNYPRLACHTQVKDLHSDIVTVKPLPNFAIIKDLVTDLTPLFQKHQSVEPYILRKDRQEMAEPTAEYKQLPEQMEAFEQFSYCVKCGICIAACPTAATDKLFLGPQALTQCYRYSADNRDEAGRERSGIADTDHGVWRCHLAGACSEVCPKGVDPALAIQLLRKQLALQSLGLGRKPRACLPVPQPSETKPKLPFPEFNV